jgi:hypothetical protein
LICQLEFQASAEISIMAKKSRSLIPAERIERAILFVRGEKVWQRYMECPQNGSFRR